MQPIPYHTVQELEQYLQTQYGAAAIEPVDYLLYNARQQLLNLFYPEVVGQLAALCGYTPDASEEVTALLDELLAQYDSQTLQSDYAQYRFVRTAPQGTRAVFYVTVERNTGFVLPQYEWEEEPAELTQEDAKRRAQRYPALSGRQRERYPAGNRPLAAVQGEERILGQCLLRSEPPKAPHQRRFFYFLQNVCFKLKLFFLLILIKINIDFNKTKDYNKEKTKEEGEDDRGCTGVDGKSGG